MNKFVTGKGFALADLIKAAELMKTLPPSPVEVQVYWQGLEILKSILKPIVNEKEVAAKPYLFGIRVRQVEFSEFFAPHQMLVIYNNGMQRVIDIYEKNMNAKFLYMWEDRNGER